MCNDKPCSDCAKRKAEALAKKSQVESSNRNHAHQTSSVMKATAMTTTPQKTLKLDSSNVSATKVLVVPKNTLATFDATNGPLVVKQLINLGTLELTYSGKDATFAATITAAKVLCLGAIQAPQSDLIMMTSELNALGGTISSHSLITVNGGANLLVRGGHFVSAFADFIATKSVKVRADRIDGKASTKSSAVNFGVAHGDLVMADSTAPYGYFWNTGGSIDIPTSATGGNDLFVAATGDITITGIDSATGVTPEAGSGRVMLNAGMASLSNGTNPPEDRELYVLCTDCTAEYQASNPVPSNSPTGSVTVNGRVLACDFSASGKNVTVNGNITIEDTSGFPDTGGCAFTYLNNLTVTGTISMPAGGVNAIAIIDSTQTQNVTLGPVKSDVYIQTFGAGTVTVGDIIGYHDVRVFAGGQLSTMFPGCSGGGGSIAIADAVTPRTTAPAKIKLGNISGVNEVILIGATGNVSVGNIALGEPTATAGLIHAVSIYANLGNSAAPVFLAGGGGTNGCGSVKNTGVHPYFGGVIAIGNGNGITVSAADLHPLSDTVGTPGLVLDAGAGTLTLNSNLNVDGTASIRAGSITLQAAALSVPGAVTISASDTTVGNTLPAPSINMAISEIPVPGNLIVKCNSDQGTVINVGPTGYFTVDWLSASYRVCAFNSVTGGVDFEGAGNISITADSDYSSVNIFGTPVTFNAGTVDVVANGATTNISINYDGNSQGNNSLISTGGVVTLNADSPLSSAGTVNLTADAINITTKFSIHTNALSSGNGGEIEITTNGGPISVAAGTVDSFLLAANGMGEGMSAGGIRIDSAAAATIDGTKITTTPGTDGDGGSIVLSATALLTLTGTLLASGNGTGSGGFVELSGDSFSMANSVISADAGAGATEESTGGSVYLFASGTDPISVGSISASTSSDVGGGTIYIYSESDSDLSVQANGTIQTSTNSDTITGSVTLAVSDTTNNNIEFEVGEAGGLSSILSAEAGAVSVTVSSESYVITDTITANTGDINIIVAPNLQTLRSGSAKERATSDGYNIAIQGTWTATNGNIFGRSSNFYTTDQTQDTTIMTPGPGKTLEITCDIFNFGQNTYLNGNASASTIVIQPDPDSNLVGLLIATTGNANFGIKSAKVIYLGTPVNEASVKDVEFRVSTDGAQNAYMFLECTGPQSQCTINSNGNVYSNGVNLGNGHIPTGPNDPNPSGPASSGCPDNLIVTAAGSITFIGLQIFANKSVYMDASSDELVITYVWAQSTGNTSSLNFTATGAVRTNGSLISAGPINISGGEVDLLGSVQALANGTTGGITGPSPISVQSSSKITLETCQIDAAGQISFYVDSAVSESNPLPALPSNISSSQVTVGSGSTIYWGNLTGYLFDSGTAGTATATFNANGYNIVFDPAEGPLEFTIGASSFSTHT